MMNTEGQKLINLDHWKTQKEIQKRQNSFSDYLKILSFNDLLNESEELVNQFKNNEEENEEEEDDLLKKSQVLMNEFTNRLEKESKFLADSVKDLKKQIEERMC